MRDMKMNDDFKDTEIGKIPKEWEIKKLEDCLCVLKNGLNNKQNKQMLGLPITRIETISTGKINSIKVGFVEGLSEEEINKYKLIKGDILFSNINSEPYLGNSAIYTGKPKILLHGMNLLLFRTNKNIFYLFLYYLLNFYRKKKIFIAISSRAVNQASINQGKIKNLIILLPPLEEQKRIAYVLSKIQNAIDIQAQLIKLLQELKKSMMHKLFIEGIGHIEFKDTEIGRIPKEWEIKALKDIGNIITGKTPSKSNSRYWLNGKIEFIKPPNLNNNIITTYSEMISDSAKNKASIVPKNSILVSCIGIIGRLGYANKEIAFNQQINGLVLNNKIAYYLFIFYILQYERKQYEILASKTTVPIINKSKFSMISIPLPPLEEQKRIAYILSTIDDKISIETKKKNSFEKLFKTMLNKLMSGQIRTKNIDVVQNDIR